jgi:hypothetical protein
MATDEREVELLREIRDAAIAVAESTIGLSEEDTWLTGREPMQMLRHLLLQYHDRFCPDCVIAPEGE